MNEPYGRKPQLPLKRCGPTTSSIITTFNEKDCQHKCFHFNVHVYKTVVHSTCDFKLAGTKHCYYFRRSGQWQFKHQKFQQKNLVNSVSFLIENSIWLYEYIPMVTSINNVPRFLAIFDLPTYLRPILKKVPM